MDWKAARHRRDEPGRGFQFTFQMDCDHIVVERTEAAQAVFHPAFVGVSSLVTRSRLFGAHAKEPSQLLLHLEEEARCKIRPRIKR